MYKNLLRHLVIGSSLCFVSACGHTDKNASVPEAETTKAKEETTPTPVAASNVDKAEVETRRQAVEARRQVEAEEASIQAAEVEARRQAVEEARRTSRNRD